MDKADVGNVRVHRACGIRCRAGHDCLRTRRTDGFTLVELIIVIAIIATLAGVIAPSLIKYIEKSKLSNANNNAEVAYKYAIEYVTECYVKGAVVDLDGIRAHTITAYDGKAITYDGSATDFYRYIDSCFASGKGHVVYTFTTYDSDDGSIDCELISATWAKNTKDDRVGSYPTLAVGRSTKKYGDFYYLPNLGD